MRENHCILELYVQPKCQASMKIEQKPFKICNDSFFFLPEFFLKKLMRLFPNKMWGINPIKGKKKFQYSGGKAKELHIRWLVNVSFRRESSRDIIKKKKKNLQIL